MSAGRVTQIWRAGATAAPMTSVRRARLLPGIGLEGDRYALGGGTWAQYPALEKQLTLIDAGEVAAVAAEVGVDLSPAATRRNLVTVGIELPALVGGWFGVGEALLFGMKRCPPCMHLERLAGMRLVKAMARRGGINAAVFAGGVVEEGAPIRALSDAEAAARGAPTGDERPVPRIVGA